MSTETEGIYLRLLGPVRAWCAGSEVTVGSPRRSAILAILALHPGHGVSREQLVAGVWGEEAPPSATGNVYTYISALRQVLEPHRDGRPDRQLLTSSGGTYTLHVREQDVDVFRMEQQRELARRCRAAGDGVGELTALKSALLLWGGEVLAGVPGPFAEAQRARLSELRLAVAERHAALLLELGRPNEAIAALRLEVEAHPRHEVLRSLLTSAVRAGVIANMSPVATPPLPAAHAGSEPLIGRDAELRGLMQAVADVTAGLGRSIRIEGAPGLGKSTLLTAVLREASAAGCLLGWAAGGEFGDQGLRRSVQMALSTAALREPARQVPTGFVDAVDGSRLWPEVGAAVELLRLTAAQRAVVLIVDDVHWTDPDTVQAWAILQRLTRELPVLLVAAARPGPGVPPGVVADEVIELGPLNRADAATLLRSTVARPDDSTLLSRLIEDAGGNPLFLRALARTNASALADPDALSDELISAVDAQLAALPKETKDILRVTAFLGGQSTVDELSAATGQRPAELLRLLEPARALGMLAGSAAGFSFRYPVVGRALRAGTPAALRTALHRSLAEKLADCGGDPERVVAQLIASSDALSSRTSRWLVEHIEQIAVRAPDSAVRLLERAHHQHTLEPDVRLVLTAWLARLMYGQRRPAIVEAGWVAARTDDPHLEAEMRWITACSHGSRGDHVAAADVAARVLSARRLPQPWLDRFRALITRLRKHLPGEPTAIRDRRALMAVDVPSDGRTSGDARVVSGL